MSPRYPSYYQMWVNVSRTLLVIQFEHQWMSVHLQRSPVCTFPFNFLSDFVLLPRDVGARSQFSTELPLKAIQPRVRNTSLHPTHGNSSVQEHYPRQSYSHPLLCCFSFPPIGKTHSFSFSLQIFYFCVFICFFIPLSCPEPSFKTCFPHIFLIQKIINLGAFSQMIFLNRNTRERITVSLTLFSNFISPVSTRW